MLELVCDRLERRPIKQVERKDGVAERKDMVEGSRLLSSVYDADNVHFSLGRVVQGAEQEVAVFRRKMSWRAGCPDLEVESQAVPCIQSRKSRVRTWTLVTFEGLSRQMTAPRSRRRPRQASPARGTQSDRRVARRPRFLQVMAIDETAWRTSTPCRSSSRTARRLTGRRNTSRKTTVSASSLPSPREGWR